MKPGEKKFKKCPPRTPHDRTDHSSILRQIAENIQKRNYPAGLLIANQALMDPALSSPAQARILSLVADSEFKRGRFSEAVQIQLQAATKSLDHATLWLRPYIGQVRALLKIPQVDQAVIMARHAVSVAANKIADFDEQVRTAGHTLMQNGSVGVPTVPPRVSVVATRMGYLFLQEGEPEVATEFFERAIKASKGGANRARQGVAQIALAKGEYDRAMAISADAIRRGEFKAKTLPAWVTLISARRQLGGWRISDRLIKGLDSAPAPLRARTILTIVAELRKNDMRQWREISERWLGREGHKFPVIAAELHKMTLASVKMEPGNAAKKRAVAKQLLQMADISPKEWLSAAKEWVRSSLWEGRDVQIMPLISTASVKFDPGFAPIVAHSLSLSCMMANRYDLARPVLRQNIQNVAKDLPIWGKSIWALARMESMLGDHVTAAALYRQFFENSFTPARFRLQAQLLWCQELITTGQLDILLEARALMTAMLGDIQDPDVLMDFARQMVVTVPELERWGREIFLQGFALALKQYEQASHPAVAITILSKLTRRQVYDFGCSPEAIQFWENLPEDKLMWLWSTNSCFWEYLGLIEDAYLRADQIEKAESFLHEWIDDPATPLEGRLQIGIPYGIWLANHSRGTKALALFERLILDGPNHPLSAPAWYWKALAAQKRGDTTERDRCATCLRNTQGIAPIRQSKWHLDAKALLLLANMEVANMDVQENIYPPDQLEALRNEMVQEMAALP